MRKTLTILVLLCGLCKAHVYGQGFKDRYFGQFGFSIFTDYSQSPLRKVSADIETVDNGNIYIVPAKGFSNYAHFGMASISYTPRINLIEISKERSISIQSPVALAFGFGFRDVRVRAVNPNPGPNEDEFVTDNSGGVSFFRINAPVFINFNFGLGSTYASDANLGFTIGVGVDISRPILFMDDIKVLPSASNVVQHDVSFMPGINIGCRYWKGEKAKEVNLKLSWLNIYTDEPEAGLLKVNPITGFAFRLSFNRFLHF